MTDQTDHVPVPPVIYGVELVRDARPFVSWDPAMRSGEPCLNHTRLPVEAVAGFVWVGESVARVADEYDITIPDVLVACWWMGTHGTRTWRKRWGEWAKAAHEQMWHSRYDIPDPPTREHERCDCPACAGDSS